jgi:hypothetical protein
MVSSGMRYWPTAPEVVPCAVRRRTERDFRQPNVDLFRVQVVAHAACGLDHLLAALARRECPAGQRVVEIILVDDATARLGAGAGLGLHLFGAAAGAFAERLLLVELGDKGRHLVDVGVDRFPALVFFGGEVVAAFFFGRVEDFIRLRDEAAFLFEKFLLVHLSVPRRARNGR